MELINPSEVVKNFGLQKGMIVADFGCGSGFYSIEMARLVGGAGDGPKGMVYALEVQKELLDAVKRRAVSEGVDNIGVIWADLDLLRGTKLVDNICDFVLISNVLFQSNTKQVMAGEAFRILKQGGRVAVIEWKKGAEVIGPPDSQRIAREELERLFLQAGFRFDREFPAGEGHVGIIFVK